MRRAAGTTPSVAALVVRRLTSLCDRREVAVPLFAVVAVLFTWPLWQRPMNLGHGDWLWYHFMWDTARKSLVDHHELPLWNPFYCGGNVALANPNGVGLSPLHWPLLVLPTAVAMKAHLTLMTLLGQWGVWEVARRWYGRGPSAIVAAVFFGCAGTIGWHMNGQTQMASLELMPWAFYFYRRGRESWPWALAAGGVLATMFLAGAVYPMVITIVTLGMHAAVSLVTSPSAMPTAKSLALTLASTPLYAAIKLLPVVDFLRDHRRPIAKDDAIGLTVLIDALFVRRGTADQIWPHVGYIYAWWGEYGNYLGVLGVAVAIVALGLSGRLRREHALLAIALALVCGDHGAWSPYALLRKLPMLGNLRVPTRYWAAFDLWLALLVAQGLWRGSRLVVLRLSAVARVPALSLLALLSLAAMGDLVRTNGQLVFRDAMPTAPAPRDEAGRGFHQVAGAAWQMWLFPPRNQGTLRCFDELTIELSPALRPNMPEEAWLDDPSAGSLAITRWTPSSFALRVATTRPATIVINQNAYRGWRAEGGVLGSRQGVVTVDVPAGERDVLVAYRPPGYVAGAALTFLSLAATAVLLAFRSRARAAAPA